ncbi:MAG: IS110 family transposase [Actinobacteria bacterium]|nr:IS110 family transposase [Actinomycetota bacterium]MCA1740265.1 IS110 family transposase [Actinomycetota bacterium]
MSQQHAVIVGIDLGDRYSHLCLLDTENGEVIEESRIATNQEAFERRFSGAEPMRVAIEASTHSPWVSRMLEDHGHEVLVANARKVRLIYGEGRKTDRIDAEKLARLARLDPKLLSPIKHRGETSQSHLALVHSRDALVGTRTKLVNHVRGTVKAFGARLPKCTAQSFHHKVAEHLPKELEPALGPVLETIASLSERIREYDRRLEEVADELYPETKLLRQIHGVGPLTALAFVLTLEDPSRFAKSRQVGPYLGLVPATDQSGKSNPQKRISKHGNVLTRKLLVNCAHYVLGPFGEDSDLRRHGEKIAGRGGKNAKKRAAVAVARKLSVLLHRLWVTAEVYEPLYNASRHECQVA